MLLGCASERSGTVREGKEIRVERRREENKEEDAQIEKPGSLPLFLRTPSWMTSPDEGAGGDSGEMV